MFIETEATPNPATLKFLPGRPVLPEGTLDIRDAEDAGQSPLAQALFAIDGVSGVFFGSDFISVTKSVGDWPDLKPVVLGAIMEHFVSGEPLLTGEFDGAAQGDGEEFFAGDDSETVITIKKLIETHVRPAVGQRWRRYQISRFPRWNRLSRLKGVVFRLSFVVRDAPTRDREFAQALRPRCARGRTNLIPRASLGPWRRFGRRQREI